MEINGLGFGLLCIAVGLAMMGYFIGRGLQNFKQPEKVSDYYTFIEESELEFYLNLSKDEIKELLNEHPEVPRIVLKGSTYYPKRQFKEWISSNEIYK